MGGRRPELGVYVKGSYVFSPLGFTSLAGDRTSVDYEFQIGALLPAEPDEQGREEATGERLGVSWPEPPPRG